MGQQLCEVSLSPSKLPIKGYGKHLPYVHCDLDLCDMIVSRSWHTLRSWIAVEWNIIQIQHGSEGGGGYFYSVDKEFGYMCIETLSMEIWPWVKVITPLGPDQELCEILSRSNMAVRCCGADTDFGYVCTVILTFEIWPCVTLDHGQEICKILSWSDQGGKKLWPRQDMNRWSTEFTPSVHLSDRVCSHLVWAITSYPLVNLNKI